MHRNSECRKIKRSTCAIPIQAAIICNSLPRQGVSNGLVIVKLKWGLKWRDHLYFEPVCLFKVTISSTRIFLLQRSFRWGYVKVFWYNDGIQGENDTDYETEYASVEELLNMNRTVTNEATLISGIPNIINKKHFQI